MYSIYGKQCKKRIVIFTVNIHTAAITLLPVLLPLLQNPTGVTGLVVCLTVYMCRVMFNICKAQCNVRSRKEPVALGWKDIDLFCPVQLQDLDVELFFSILCIWFQFFFFFPLGFWLFLYFFTGGGREWEGGGRDSWKVHRSTRLVCTCALIPVGAGGGGEILRVSV